MSPCNYDRFAKMKEPLQGTHYNTGGGIICPVGRSLLDISSNGHADGVQHLPKIWLKAVHMGAIILKECKSVYLR
jgi:hypothetical protein